MELKYQIPTKAHYLEESDEYEYDYKEVEFEPSVKELSECVATCIFNEYFEQGFFDGAERKEIIGYIKEFISDKDLTEDLAKKDYDIQVYDWFEKEVMKRYG